MQTELHLSAQIVAEMRHHVSDCAPLEACGLLSGRSERAENVFLITNATQSRVRFRMDPQEQYNAFLQIEDQGQELLGIFHSHPTGPEMPSPTDLDEAAYPVVHLIWFIQNGVWQMRGFWIEDGQIFEVTLNVDDKE